MEHRTKLLTLNVPKVREEALPIFVLVITIADETSWMVGYPNTGSIWPWPGQHRSVPGWLACVCKTLAADWDAIPDGVTVTIDCLTTSHWEQPAESFQIVSGLRPDVVREPFQTPHRVLRLGRKEPAHEP